MLPGGGDELFPGEVFGGVADGEESESVTELEFIPPGLTAVAGADDSGHGADGDETIPFDLMDRFQADELWEDFGGPGLVLEGTDPEGSSPFGAKDDLILVGGEVAPFDQIAFGGSEGHLNGLPFLSIEGVEECSLFAAEPNAVGSDFGKGDILERGEGDGEGFELLSIVEEAALGSIDDDGGVAMDPGGGLNMTEVEENGIPRLGGGSVFEDGGLEIGRIVTPGNEVTLAEILESGETWQGVEG